MSKIVVLNSGGFDSITLLHDLALLENEREIYSLHFLYGARNEEQQLRCVKNVCSKLGIHNEIVRLPKITWTKSEFFKKGEYRVDTQYLEYRNLIFLSYALSYAEAIGADKIYAAVLKSGGYPDTSKVFFEGLNHFSKQLSGISIETPYADVESKYDLLQTAILTGIQPREYFSCDKPDIWGTPCGECLDCKSLEPVEEVIKVDHPFKALYQSGFNYSDETFRRLLKETPKDREVRALINSDCQLKCSHCFYGFENMAGDLVDEDTYYSALKTFVTSFGFTNIHFSGKEPLYDDKILRYARRIKEDNLPCTFNVVTNGINVPKYVKELQECGMNKVFLSVDSINESNGVRTLDNKVAEEAIRFCNQIDMEVEVFIDLHNNNYYKIGDILLTLRNLGVKKFLVRTIRSIGNAVNQELLSGEKLCAVFEQIEVFCKNSQECEVSYHISSEYVPTVLDNEDLQKNFSILDSLYTTWWLHNMGVSLERYCNRYHDITLTPDGYVLGCASEVSRPDYASKAAGNIRYNLIGDILKIGEELRCSCAGMFPRDSFSCMTNKF